MSAPSVEAAEEPAASATVAADFGRGADYPLLKSKFAAFNSGIVPLTTYERDAEFFAIAKPESLRIDLGWGTDWAGWAEQPIHGTPEAPVYHFREMDGIAKVLNDRNVLPYWSYCYNPTPLQDPQGAWQGVPSDMAAWGRILGDVARHYRSLGDANPVGYHEIYNEPDNEYFSVGTIDDYFAMYDSGARAIQAADPEALVGGPALAFTLEWIEPFVDFVAEKKLPFDFFSTHVYGTEDGYDRLDAMLDASRDALDRHPAFATVELHLNEFNSYPIDYPIDGTQQKHRLAAVFLRDMGHLLAWPEVTLVHWAQFLDCGQGNYSGMISIDGHRKALFNAAEIYARLPIDRSPVEIGAAADVGALAGRDGHRAGLVVWNLGLADQTVAVRLGNVPFPTGTLRVYRIDADHASWGDGAPTEHLVPVQTHEAVATASLAWNGEIPSGGIVYFEFENARDRTDAPPNQVARWLRTLRYYPDRTTTAYGDFDKNTWTFRLGMATAETADVEVGVTAEALPDVLAVTVEAEGTLRARDAESLLGLRIDFRVDGDYALGVLVHGPYRGVDLFDQGRVAAMPWGTGRPPDRVMAVDDLAIFHLPVRSMAPAGWDGRAQITAIMHDSGAGTRAKIRLRRG